MQFVNAAATPGMTPVAPPNAERPEAVAVVPESSSTELSSDEWNIADWSSLIVALIALMGVLWNTYRNDQGREKEIEAAAENRRNDQAAADRRRREDQEAEDDRRKIDRNVEITRRAMEDLQREREREQDREAEEKLRKAEHEAAEQRRLADQQAEDDRRKADDDRRDHERQKQLKREDRDRQRRAVADCIRELTKLSAQVNERAAATHLQENGTAEKAKLVKAVELSQFYAEATAQMTLLDIEVTDPHVSAQVSTLWEQLVDDYEPLKEAQKRGGQEWIAQAEAMPPLSDRAMHAIRTLTIITRLSLLEFPEHMENQPVVRIDPKESGKDYDDE